MTAKDQQLFSTQDSLREAQEDLARDEVIFAGKIKELHELRDANDQLQVSHVSVSRGSVSHSMSHVSICQGLPAVMSPKMAE